MVDIWGSLFSGTGLRRPRDLRFHMSPRFNSRRKVGSLSLCKTNMMLNGWLALTDKWRGCLSVFLSGLHYLMPRGIRLLRNWSGYNSLIFLVAFGSWTISKQLGIILVNLFEADMSFVESRELTMAHILVMLKIREGLMFEIPIQIP